MQRHPRAVKISSRVTEINIEGEEYEITERPNMEPQLRMKKNGRWSRIEESAEPEYVFPVMDYLHSENARKNK